MTKMPPKDRFQSLTKREKEVLQLICQHNSYQKIADELFIGKTTVKTHMHNIYIKLELEDLARDERIMQIHNVYCPLFLEVDEPKKRAKRARIGSGEPKPAQEKQTKNQSKEAQIVPIEPEPEPEPITPEEEAVIDADEMALITYKPISISAGGKKNVEKPKKKRGCFKYIFGFILGVACTIGAWQGWLYVKEIPVVVSIIEIINPDFIQEPEVEAVIVETPYTQPVAEPTAKSEVVTSEPEVQPQASAPQVTAVVENENNTDQICELNDWCKQDGVWLRMMDYKFTESFIDIYFEIWNKTGQDILFSWSSKGNFSLVDNQDNRYEASFSQTEAEQLANNERLQLKSYGQRTLQYENDPIYGEGVTDLYLTAEYFSRIDKAVFHIPVGK